MDDTPSTPPGRPNEPPSQGLGTSPSLGKRVLAAVMFTDAVAFSARTNENEEHALRITARDLATITDIVRRFDGRVIKRTGDGVLAFFTSGVQAVAGALEIQHTMAEQAKSLPPNEVLQHRIGIHLGDVFVTRGEVMGDGVNVAARLQTEAPPGGICITQALYEVAKNRLSLRTAHLGAKQLKNFKESVQVYQVLTEADAARETGEPPVTVAAPSAPVEAKPRPARRPMPRRIRWAAGGAVAAAALAALVWMLSGPVARMFAGSPPAPASDTSLLDAPTRKEYEQARARYLPSRDYDALAAWIRERSLDGLDSPLATDYAKYKRLGVLLGWLEGELTRFRKSEPLVARGGSGSFPVWFEDGRAMTKSGKTERPLNLRTAPAAVALAVMDSAARERWRGQSIDRDDPRARLIEGIHLFARENGLSVDGLLAGFKRPGDLLPLDEGLDAFDPFLRFDANGDGKLTFEEIPPAFRAKLKPADADGDGVITRAEMLRFRRRATGP